MTGAIVVFICKTKQSGLSHPFQAPSMISCELVRHEKLVENENHIKTITDHKWRLISAHWLLAWTSLLAVLGWHWFRHRLLLHSGLCCRGERSSCRTCCRHSLNDGEISYNLRFVMFYLEELPDIPRGH